MPYIFYASCFNKEKRASEWAAAVINKKVYTSFRVCASVCVVINCCSYPFKYPYSLFFLLDFRVFLLPSSRWFWVSAVSFYFMCRVRLQQIGGSKFYYISELLTLHAGFVHPLGLYVHYNLLVGLKGEAVTCSLMLHFVILKKAGRKAPKDPEPPPRQNALSCFTEQGHIPGTVSLPRYIPGDVCALSKKNL